jgi:DNA adenine methylase
MPKFESYIEPFLGSGAVLYTVGAGAAIASDIYEPLIALWKLVQKDPNLVIEDYREKWLALSEEIDTLSEFDIKKRSGLPQYYYKVRDRFNCEQDPLDLNFLMRTCVNGIVRFNDEGKFNNSFHLSRRGMEPERFARVVNDWSAVLKNVTFVCQDYEQTVERAQKSDFIYFDPPYAGNHQRYVENLDLVRFFTVLERLNQRGVKWALSFDGRRGDVDLTHDVPGHLFKRQVYLENGISAVHKVLNGPIERVQESLYLNY